MLLITPTDYRATCDIKGYPHPPPELVCYRCSIIFSEVVFACMHNVPVSILKLQLKLECIRWREKNYLYCLYLGQAPTLTLTLTFLLLLSCSTEQ